MNFTLLDGGMGRELQRMGAPFGQPEWSARALIEEPAWVEKAHRRFQQAGAQLLTVNAYACVPFHLGETRFQNDGPGLIALAAKLAANVAQEAESPCTVAGCLPPVFGSYRPDLFDAEKALPILQTLIDNQKKHVQLWLAETLSSLAEMETVLTALKTAENHLPIYLSFTLDDAPARPATLRSGESVQTAARAAIKAGADALLFNCSVPEAMEAALTAAATVRRQLHSSLQLGVYPNAFTPITTGHQANTTLQELRELSPQEFVTFCHRWHKAGATLLGGCCGITPEHLAALAREQNG